MRTTRPHQPPPAGIPGPAYGPPSAHPVPPAAPLPPSAWREAPTPGPSSARLHCPKCHGELVTYERQGVHLEQCRDCRGIWLDRGELDRLIDAEASFAAPAYQAPAYEPAGRERRDDDDRHRGYRGDDDRRGYRGGDDRRGAWSGDDDDDDDRRGRRDDDDGYPGRRPSRRRSVFGDLFEGLIE